jgi:hypothetical protein
MQLEGALDLERTRVQRWVPVVAIVVPVFICMAVATWFIRAFIAPPMIAIPGPMAVAAVAPPEHPVPPSYSPPPSPPVRSERAAVSPAVAAFSEPPSATLPMFATFALAPPSASLGVAPAATVEPEPSASPLPPPQADNPNPVPGAFVASQPVAVASLPPDAPDSNALAALGPSTPLTGPIPLPPPRPEVAALAADAQVPLPRTRPEAQAAPERTDAERRVFNAHGAE